MDAAVYARISHVLDDSTIGVDRQEADGRAMVERKGWNLAAVHVDNNRSAWRRNRKRPGWDALLDDIRERRVGAVIVAHPDRLIRQPRDLEDLLDLARDTGVQLVSAGGNRDLSNPDDVFILRIEVAHACRSSEDTSRRVARAHEAAAAEGRPGGGTGRRRPYGYTDDQLEVVPAEAAVITEAAAQLLAGRSLGSICSDLDAAGVATVSGAPWSRTALAGILRSPRTAGLREHRKQIVGPAVWPAILDRPTWEAVCSVLDRPAMPGQNRRKHLLSGLVRCEPCGQPFAARGGVPPGYACTSCHQRVARHLLDAEVHAELASRLDDDRLRTALAEPVSSDDEADLRVEADCDQRIEKILDEWEAVGASSEWVRKKVDQIKAEKAEATRRRVARARRGAFSGLPVHLDLESLLALPLETRRALVADLLPNLRVRPSTRRGRGFDDSRLSFD